MVFQELSVTPRPTWLLCVEPFHSEATYWRASLAWVWDIWSREICTSSYPPSIQWRQWVPCNEKVTKGGLRWVMMWTNLICRSIDRITWIHKIGSIFVSADWQRATKTTFVAKLLISPIKQNSQKPYRYSIDTIYLMQHLYKPPSFRHFIANSLFSFFWQHACKLSQLHYFFYFLN